MNNYCVDCTNYRGTNGNQSLCFVEERVSHITGDPYDSLVNCTRNCTFNCDRFEAKPDRSGLPDMCPGCQHYCDSTLGGHWCHDDNDFIDDIKGCIAFRAKVPFRERVKRFLRWLSA